VVLDNAGVKPDSRGVAGLASLEPDSGSENAVFCVMLSIPARPGRPTLDLKLA
jgi:hypothetical protein